MPLETMNADAASGTATANIDTGIVQRSAGGDGPLSVRDAARSLTDTRRKDPENSSAESAEPGDQAAGGQAATAGQRAGQESATADVGEEGAASRDATPPPGETTATDQASEQPPPIEPPRSWTKEDKELFKGLPRETQERLVDRERSREGDFLKRQQEATERAKALEAERGRVDQARQQYEAALPTLLHNMQQQQAGEFGDVKTFADVERISIVDPARFVRWQAQQLKIGQVAAELQATQALHAQEQSARFADFSRREDDLLAEKVPDVADKAKAAKLQDAALDVLRSVGFTDNDLIPAWNGQDKLSLRDHRLQLVILDAVKYRDAQAAARTARPKPVPPVQRPGTAQPRTAAADQQVQELANRLNQSGNLRDAAALLAARRRAAG
jgi:hypothetical protein